MNMMMILLLLAPSAVHSFVPFLNGDVGGGGGGGGGGRRRNGRCCRNQEDGLILLWETSPTSGGQRRNRDDDEESKNNKATRNKKKNPKKNPTPRPVQQQQQQQQQQTWRIYGIEVHPDDMEWNPKQEQLSRRLRGRGDDNNGIDNDGDTASDKEYLHPAVIHALYQKYPKLAGSKNMKVVRRSLDARRNKPRTDGKGRGPRFVFVLDVTIDNNHNNHGLKHQPGKVELLIPNDDNNNDKDKEHDDSSSHNATTTTPYKVIIVGAGPAGLFCALELLAEQQQQQKHRPIQVIVLERGQPVERRGQDIGALMHRRELQRNSNFCFGEGGAGTWSDGKLTTRIGRNSDHVQHVLQTLVHYGAPPIIKIHGAPHLGTDNLVRLLRNLRFSLQEQGAQILFGTQMKQLIMNGTRVVGVEYTNSTESSSHNSHDDNHNDKDNPVSPPPTTTTTVALYGDAVVLATGHSARDVYVALHHQQQQSQVPLLEPKGFAVGFRIEHPQYIINRLQYGTEWGPSAQTGKTTTDTKNLEYFGGTRPHSSNLPVPSYRLATDQAWDGTRQLQQQQPLSSSSFRGVYSFCMCPGGQIVPASTDPTHLCVNGMSFSRRDSIWANSALVVTVAPDDAILEPYKVTHGNNALAGVAFQQDMERRAAIMGGGNLTVPVQRVTDFMTGTISTTIPSSSYRLGVRSAPLHELYPTPLTMALRNALEQFNSVQMPGYVCDEALLHGVETRTSSPVRIPRDKETLQAMDGLYPAGEGAGFAGGIVSAAVDGLHVAQAILETLDDDGNGNNGNNDTDEVRRQKQNRRAKSAGETFY